MKYKSRYGLKLLYGNIYSMFGMFKELEVKRPIKQSEKIFCYSRQEYVFICIKLLSCSYMQKYKLRATYVSTTYMYVPGHSLGTLASHCCAKTRS